MTEPTSRLRYLGGCYFHQDYDLDAPDSDGVIRNFVHDEVPQAAEELIDEIVTVLATQPSEESLKVLWLDTYDSYFEPETVGLTYREWFVRMLEILRAP